MFNRISIGKSSIHYTLAVFYSKVKLPVHGLNHQSDMALFKQGGFSFILWPFVFENDGFSRILSLIYVFIFHPCQAS